MIAEALSKPPSRYPVNWVVLLFFIGVHGVTFPTPWFFSWSALGIMLLLHWLFGSLGICLGYHRLLSHRSLPSLGLSHFSGE